MSMSTHIVGVRDLDGQFALMMKAKLACEAAGIAYPKQLSDYFRFPAESEEYLRNEMESVDIAIAISRCDGVDGSDPGWEVDLLQLPEGVKAIRFFNSY